MNRIALIVAACLAVATAVLVYLRAAEPAPVAADARAAEIIERLDRLEKSMARIAPARADAPAADGFATPPAPAAGGRAVVDEDRVAAARDAAIRDGNDIVDRALGVGQWTAEDARSLAASTGTLDGETAAAIEARVSAAINSDRLKLAPSALRP